MVSAIPRRNDTRSPEKPRKLSNPRLQGDKLIVRLKLRPSILAQFPTKPRSLEEKPTTRPLLKENETHQLNFISQLIDEQFAEIERLKSEIACTSENIDNYARVHEMHSNTMSRTLADACDLGMTSCEKEDGDGDVMRFLKDEIQQTREGLNNWYRILSEARQEVASKKYQISMIVSSLKALEKKRRDLSQ
ncbi:unnamed protein product [Fusarium venenatum]|uniref:Uncharacterized protein n=1 Tax=Fusarium venenatum TaxID=56646 RepID=A0A2L2T1N2_9HYPO|nr:uncharacterized protein FVRRES_12634 [Fusarium venenatum]KAH6979228.1 hypothetical protein EDB82DRAFT_248355 [Fusarium venenatum]CEI39943.1 unnamed protein product [Fusarium venenatum]